MGDHGLMSQPMEDDMYYEAIGSVRGSCGHRHRSADKAAECAERDRKACRSLGGGAYSDRRTVRRSDGELYGVSEVLEGASS